MEIPCSSAPNARRHITAHVTASRGTGRGTSRRASRCRRKAWEMMRRSQLFKVRRTDEAQTGIVISAVERLGSPYLEWEGHGMLGCVLN